MTYHAHMSTPPVKTCVTYCRISADRFGTEAGVDRQRVDTDRIAEAAGWRIVERIVDNDRSASRYARRGREGWSRLMELVELGAVDAVVAYDLDRLTRQPRELERLIDAAERGVLVRTATGVLDLSSDAGVIVARTMVNVAEHEARAASRRQKAKLRHDAEQGRPHWPRRPFGFTLAGELVADEARWIERMATMVVDEGMSLTAVAIEMNKTNVRPTGGANWQSQGVKDVIGNPRVAGLRAYHGEIIGRAAWPAILPEDRWRQVVAAIAARSPGTRGGRRGPLTGMMRCARCGKPMTRTNGTDKAEYRCNKGDPSDRGCGQSIKASAVEAVVAAVVLDLLGDVTASASTRTDDTSATELLDLRHQLDELAALLGAGELTMAEWKAARTPLLARVRAAEAAMAQVDARHAARRLVGDVATLRQSWPHMEPDQRRRITALVIAGVRISPSVRRMRGVDYDRIEVVPVDAVVDAGV